MLRSFHRPVRRWVRALAAAALLAASLAGSFAAHHHSLFSPGEELSSHIQDRFLTRHDPFSPARHWHAVIAVVHEQDCVACHNLRLAGVLTQRQDPTPVACTLSTAFLAPARTLRVSLHPSGSRAPPALL
jgi:hypothetical protein